GSHRRRAAVRQQTSATWRSRLTRPTTSSTRRPVKTRRTRATRISARGLWKNRTAQPSGSPYFAVCPMRPWTEGLSRSCFGTSPAAVHLKGFHANDRELRCVRRLRSSNRATQPDRGNLRLSCDLRDLGLDLPRNPLRGRIDPPFVHGRDPAFACRVHSPRLGTLERRAADAPGTARGDHSRLPLLFRQSRAAALGRA